MASFVNDKLSLEQKIEVIRLLVLHNAHLHRLTVVLVIEILGPKSRCSLLILTKET